MTLKELLENINTIANARNEDKEIFYKYQLQMEYNKTSAYPYDDQTYETEEPIVTILISPDTKTITFKNTL